MTSKEFRSKELQYRRNPDQIFASLADLIQVCQLVMAGASKLDDLVATIIEDLWTDRAAHTFMQVVRSALGYTNLPQGFDGRVLAEWLIRHLGNWAAQSPETAKKFFGKVIEGLYLDQPNMEREQCLSSIAAVWFGIQHNANILNNSKSPIPPLTPIRLMYMAAREGDEQALKLLDTMSELMRLYHCYPLPWASRDAEPADAYWFPTLGYEEYLQWSRKNEMKLLSDSGVPELVRKANEKMPEILSLIEALWTDIIENARCGIRPEGEDTFYFSGPWEKLGRAHRYFYTGEMKFPDVGIAIGHEYGPGQVIWEQVEFTTKVKEECLSNGALGALPYLGNLIAYHEIVCRAPAKRNGKASKRAKPVSTVTPEAVMINVRHYERTLPPNQQSRADRDLFFKKFGRELADGKTYVSSHKRSMVPGERLILGLSGKPNPNFSIDIEAIIEKL